DAGASGWASVPGTRVDVVWMCRRGGDENTYTELLLENVMILAADIHTKGPEGQAQPASVVTLAVNRRDALRLRLAAEQGPIHLLLRNFADKSTGDMLTCTNKELYQRLASGKGFASGDQAEADAASAMAPFVVPAAKRSDVGKAAPETREEPRRF